MPEMLPMSSSSSWEEPTTTVIAILVRHVTTVSPQHLEAVCQWKVFMNSLEDAPSKLQPLEGLQLPKQFTVHIEGYPYVLDCTILTTAGYDTKGRPQVDLKKPAFARALKPSCRNPWLTVAAKTMMSSGLIFTAVRIHCYGILDTAR
uniref:Uncharacterized protein n=1 Tax=Oryza barthii TaxID=65489 RepID=A0A0D3HAS7_9ORYZ